MRRIAALTALTLAFPVSALADEDLPEKPIAPSMTGSSGIIRVQSARVGNVGYWDIAGHGQYFQQKPFIVDPDSNQEEDYNEYTGAVGAASWAPLRFLELYVSSQVRTNFNSSKDDVDPEGDGTFVDDPNIPNLDNATGSINAGFKGSLPLDPIWLGLMIGTRSPPNVDEIQFRPDTFGGEFMGIATLDMSERGIPFRMHVNGGYIVDRSGILIVEDENPARTFALNLSNYNSYAYGIGFEAPFKYATPFFEFYGQQVASLNSTCDSCPKPTQSISDAAKGSPRFATIGVRVTPVDGLALDLSYDAGLAAERPVQGVPATPDSQVVFGASYAFASRSRHREFLRESGEISDAARAQIDAANSEVERLKSELEKERLAREVSDDAAKGTTAEMKAMEAKMRALSGFRGLVLDAETFAPIGDAIVSFPETNLSRILADATSGFFRSYTFQPSTISVSVGKTGYETLLQSVAVTGNADEVVRFLLKKEGGGVSSNTPGLFRGNIYDEEGKPVPGTLSFPDAPFKTKEVQTTGAFSIKIPPGLYQVDVKAPGYLLQGKRISVGPGEKVIYDFNLRKRPIDPRVISNGDRLTLKDVINFAFNKDVIVSFSM